jgi:hypothetical protein
MKFLVILVIVTLIVIILWGAYKFYFSVHIAKRLMNAGWYLYVNPSCGFCHKQLLLLEGRMDANIITCDKGQKLPELEEAISDPDKYKTDTDAVLAGSNTITKNNVTLPSCALLTAYPFWYNVKTKKQMYGYKDLYELLKMADYID